MTLPRSASLILLLVLALPCGLFYGFSALCSLSVPAAYKGRPATAADSLPPSSAGAFCDLSGTPWQQGEILAAFSQGSWPKVERHLLAAGSRAWGSKALAMIAFRYQDLSARRRLSLYPSEDAMAMAGFAAASRDQHPEYGPGLYRLLQYQDIWQGSWGGVREPALAGLAFALGPVKSQTGGVLLAAGWDSEWGNPLDGAKLVVRVAPERGYRWVGVTWPGLAGTVAGFNEKGLAVAWMPARSAVPGDGVTGALLARKMLEQAADIDAAAAVARSLPAAGGNVYLLASAGGGAFTVLEQTPQRTVAGKPGRGFTAAAGVFSTREMAADAADRRFRRESPVAARLFRVRELLNAAREPLSPSAAARILRDMRGSYERPLAAGHPASVNTLQTALAVVMDPGHNTLWVADTPSPLGAFRALPGPGAAAPAAADIPADAFLTSGRFGEYAEYRRRFAEAERMVRRRQYREALALLLEIQATNPNDYRFHALAGRALQGLRRWDEAYYNHQSALRLRPAWRRERRDLEKRLRLIEKKR